MKFILRLNEISKDYLSELGPKVAYLGEFFDEVKIPSGFVIIGEVLIKELDNLIGDKIDNMISSINFLNDSEVQTFANNLQKKIVFTEFSEKLEYKLKLAYKSINYSTETNAEDLLKEENTLVAVRTSFNNPNDLPKRSIQRVNYLNIFGEDRFMKSIKTSLASLFLKDMLKYYHANNLSWRDMRFSILVQEMINAEKSGQVMTYIPEKINKDVINEESIMVLSVFGLGECLSGGFVEPDVSIVDPKTNRLLFRNNGNQVFIYTLDKEKMKTAKVELGEKGKQQVLNDKEVQEIARLGKRIKKKFSSDVVVEWSMVDNKVYVLQITPRKFNKPSSKYTEYNIKKSIESKKDEVYSEYDPELKKEKPKENSYSNQNKEKVNTNDPRINIDSKINQTKKNIEDEKHFESDSQKDNSSIHINKDTEKENFDSKTKSKENKTSFDPLSEISKEEISDDDLSSKRNSKSNVQDLSKKQANQSEDNIEIQEKIEDEIVKENMSVFDDQKMKETPVGKEEIDINEILEIYDKTVSDIPKNHVEDSSNGKKNVNSDESIKENSNKSLREDENNSGNDNKSNESENDVTSNSNSNNNNEKENNNNSGFLLSNIKSDLNMKKRNDNKSKQQGDLDILLNIRDKIKIELKEKLKKNFESYSLLDIAHNMEGLLSNEVKAGLKKVHSLINKAKEKKEITPKDISIAYKILLTVREFTI
ncbi:MAG: PEP/pyruvate-binding domain-containing protein [Candidatus Woesearchaeota archaeon]